MMGGQGEHAGEAGGRLYPSSFLLYNDHNPAAFDARFLNTLYIFRGSPIKPLLSFFGICARQVSPPLMTGDFLVGYEE